MANVIDKTVEFMKKNGTPQRIIDTMVARLKDTCVACKHAEECRNLGIVSEPYQPKCDRHELVGDFVKK